MGNGEDALQSTALAALTIICANWPGPVLRRGPTGAGAREWSGDRPLSREQLTNSYSAIASGRLDPLKSAEVVQAPRAVVTGGAGFLGSHLCEGLLRRGFDVLCLDNFLTGTPANVAHLLPDPRFELIRADATEYLAIRGPVGYVLHFASPASPADYLRMPIETLKVGSLGTLNALELAREKQARFLLASTSEVYGDPEVHPQPESYWGNVNPVGPRGVYDEAKRFAEALTVAYRATHGVDTAIARIFNTYGPRMRPNDGRAIPTFIRQALHGEPLTVAGDGAQTRSVVYVDDEVDGLLRLLLSNHSGPINIGSQDEWSILDLAQLIIEVVGTNVSVLHTARPVDDPRVRRPDITLAIRDLGWSPTIPLEAGLRTTVAWFASQVGRAPRATS